MLLTQRFQVLEGRMGDVSPLAKQRLDGAQIGFTAQGRRHTGQVMGATMRGTVEGGGWTATRIAG